jgi:GNAT superfamily N-acetyltransferase
MPRTNISDAAEIDHALEVFVRGFCAVKSATHPYEHFRVGKLWVMRDALRKNPRYYRKEEWVAFGVEPQEVHAAARKAARGRFFVCALAGAANEQAELRAGYKQLGYRLISTEPLFVHRLKRIPKAGNAIPIERVQTPELAERLGKATRSRPIPSDQLTKDAPFRQYVAIADGELFGWVRSVNAGDSTWCANMYVRPVHRRQGIGRALLCRMLKDDRRHGFRQSVLLSSHTGALVYPGVGYEQLGLLLIFAPPRAVTRQAGRHRPP